MKITILTIAPEVFTGIRSHHIIDRACRIGRLSLEIVDIRDYADGCFRKVDDSPYGGGAGMILRCEPVLQALEAVRQKSSAGLFSAALAPRGETYSQKMASDLSEKEHLVLVCGHFEGMDERIYAHMDMTISIGDYVLSGGEIAAMAMIDSIARLLPGVLKTESLMEESFSSNMLEYPQYTRPADYRGEKVPEVLLSGNHEAIAAWRREASLELTGRLRPDLLDANNKS